MIGLDLATWRGRGLARELESECVWLWGPAVWRLWAWRFWVWSRWQLLGVATSWHILPLTPPHTVVTVLLYVYN